MSMRANKSLIVGIVTVFLIIGTGLIAFQFKNNITSILPENFMHWLGINSANTHQGISPALQDKINTYRKPGSLIPLKETPIWELLRVAELGAGDAAKFKRARVVRVINMPLDYEVELLATGEHRIMSISPQMDFFVPQYIYTEEGNIKTAEFSSVDRGDILSVLEEGSLIVLFVEKSEVASNDSNSDLNRIEVEWFVLAD